MVGGRSYNESQYNRAVAARRQPGSVFKPFVYLAAFERAADEGRTDLTPASMTLDEPSTFSFDDQVWEPRNYDEYDGEITFRRALAMSRNLATIHVGETIGFDRVAALWRRVGRRHAAAGGPVDYARRVRADATRSRAGVHAVRQRRERSSPDVHPARPNRPRRHPLQRIRHCTTPREPTPRFSSPT